MRCPITTGGHSSHDERSRQAMSALWDLLARRAPDFPAWPADAAGHVKCEIRRAIQEIWKPYAKELRPQGPDAFVLFGADFMIDEKLGVHLSEIQSGPGLPTNTKAVRDVIADPACTLQPEEVFINKVVSLYEIFSVRHCVFVLGAAGSAKSQVWQTLARAQSSISLEGGKTAVCALNPKAVTSNELYGYVHPVTKEPYDGIIAKMMREFSKNASGVPK